MIHLYDLEDKGLILLYPSGVAYTNQTGGFACRQPVVEGVFVPLGGDPAPLHDYFTGYKYGGHCDNGIDEEDARAIDAFLEARRGEAYIIVDRGRLADSHEAWIYVTVREDRAPFFPLFQGFGQAGGVLTWPNSD